MFGIKRVSRTMAFRVLSSKNYKDYVNTYWKYHYLPTSKLNWFQYKYVRMRLRKYKWKNIVLVYTRCGIDLRRCK